MTTLHHVAEHGFPVVKVSCHGRPLCALSAEHKNRSEPQSRLGGRDTGRQFSLNEG